MANDEDLARIRQGAAVWNNWRAENRVRRVDLYGADLKRANLGVNHYPLTYGSVLDPTSTWALGILDADANPYGVDLQGVDLRHADLGEADLRGAHLHGADLQGADLQGANLSAAGLRTADLRTADLRGAHLHGADLQGANLSAADLQGANLALAELTGVNLVETNLTDADLTGCCIYGISAWNLKLQGAKQRDLVITRPHEPSITVDNLEVAQFIYLLLHNEKIRNVIDTITSKVVLILGRFTPQERKAVLDALREELRKRDYLPVLFDFDKPASRNITETVSLLAGMARFVVADITDARSIPQELMVIAPALPSVAIQPLLQEGAGEYGMFEHFRRYPWVLKEHVYASPQQLIADLSERVIGPAEAKVRELRA